MATPPAASLRRQLSNDGKAVLLRALSEEGEGDDGKNGNEGKDRTEGKDEDGRSGDSSLTTAGPASVAPRKDLKLAAMKTEAAAVAGGGGGGGRRAAGGRRLVLGCDDCPFQAEAEYLYNELLQPGFMRGVVRRLLTDTFAQWGRMQHGMVREPYGMGLLPRDDAAPGDDALWYRCLRDDAPVRTNLLCDAVVTWTDVSGESRFCGVSPVLRVVYVL